MKKLLFLLIIFLAVLQPRNSFASAGVSLSVQPSQIEYSGKPGTSEKGYVSVINKGNVEVKLKVASQDFRYINQGGDIEFYIKNQDSALTWLVPQYIEITIPPYGAKTVQYIVTVPKGTKAGGHLGALNFHLEGQKEKKFGALFFLNVIDSGITTGGTVTNFSTPKFQYASAPKLNLAINNSGNANLFATGTMAFKDWRGKKVAEFQTNSIVVAPNNSRLFNIGWNNNNLLGIYKAELNLTNSLNKTQKLQAETWFFVFPWKKMLVFIPLALLVLILAIFNPFKFIKNSFS